MKATQAQYLFLGATVLVAVIAGIQYAGKKKAIKAIQSATDLPTLKALYPVTTATK